MRIMKTRLSPLSALALAAISIPASRLCSQAPHDVNGTIRVAVGEGRGDGGNYSERRLHAFSIAMDFARHREGGSGLVGGVGFTYFQGAGEGLIAYPASIAPVIVIDCTPGIQCGRPLRERFPDVRLAYVDLGWRRATHDFRGDLLFQPGVALTSRADVAPIGLGARASVARRIVGPFGIELGASSTYLPGFFGARVGLSQLTLGLRSW